MCGIVGFIGQESAVPYLLEGLIILENRGYDSAGLSTISPDRHLITTKFAGQGAETDAIARLKNHVANHVGHTIGIAHTRWATHGGKTDFNAHPHHDEKNRLALVHNGGIENANQLREELTKKGAEPLAPRLLPCGSLNQAEKDDPQPQVLVAFGFLMTNCEP